MTEKKIRTPRKTTKTKPVEKPFDVIKANELIERLKIKADEAEKGNMISLAGLNDDQIIEKLKTPNRFQDEQERFRRISEQVEKERHR